MHHLYIYLDVKVEVEIEEIEEQWNENYFSVPRDSETLSGLPQTQPQFVRTCGIIDSRWNDSNKKVTRGPPVLQFSIWAKMSQSNLLFLQFFKSPKDFLQHSSPGHGIGTLVTELIMVLTLDLCTDYFKVDQSLYNKFWSQI